MTYDKNFANLLQVLDLMTGLKLFLIALFSPIVMCAQADRSLVKNWARHPVPQNEQTEMLYSKNYWRVFLIDDQIKASNILSNHQEEPLPFEFTPSGFIEQMNMKGSKSVMKVDDGYLVGFDNGEFGGSLYWFSKDGKQKDKIARKNIKQFVWRNNLLYAIAGLNHMGSDYGSIHLITNPNGKWAVKDYLTLPNAPMAVALDSHENLIIATSSALLAVDTNKQITLLEAYHNWQPNMYPSSLVIKDDVVYVGMMEGIYKYDLTTKQDAWLLPKSD